MPAVDFLNWNLTCIVWTIVVLPGEKVGNFWLLDTDSKS